MTIEEWNDEVARMTPRQREAMACYGFAQEAFASYMEYGWGPGTAPTLKDCLIEGLDVPGQALNDLATLYPGDNT